MVQGVAAAAAATVRHRTLPAAEPLRQDRPGDYGRDWRAPASAPAKRAAPAARNDGPVSAASIARTRESALLAADVYADTPNPPPGFAVADDAQLTRLGLTRDMLEAPGVSSFRARVYVTGSGEGQRFVVAFRGSHSAEDWRNNGQQALGFDAPSYAKALAIGQRLARSEASVTLTGHSLGGGLASAAAVASGRQADTFIAAGLNGGTIDRAEAIARSAGRGPAIVQAWSVRGEVLSMLQNGGDRVAGGLLGVPLGPIGIGGGAAIVDAPEAYGSRRTLPDVRPEGRSFWDGLNPINRHGMDWVLAGVQALR